MTAFTLPVTHLDVPALGAKHDATAQGPQATAEGREAVSATPGWVLPLAILCAPLVLLGASLLPLLGGDVRALTDQAEADAEGGAA
jgi:hypothetical protein